jgi:hypothetical protein
MPLRVPSVGRIVGHLVLRKAYSSSVRLLRYQHELAYLLAKGSPKQPACPIPDVIDFRYNGNRLHPHREAALGAAAAGGRFFERRRSGTRSILRVGVNVGSGAATSPSFPRHRAGQRLSPTGTLLSEPKMQTRERHSAWDVGRIFRASRCSSAQSLADENIFGANNTRTRSALQWPN